MNPTRGVGGTPKRDADEGGAFQSDTRGGKRLSLTLSLSRVKTKKRERVSSRGRLDERGRFPVRQSRRFFVGRDPERLLGIMWVCFFWVRFFLFFFVKSRFVEKKDVQKREDCDNIFEDSLSA